MSTLTVDDAPASRTPDAPPRRARRHGRLLTIYTWIVIIWLLLPIAVMILFSFNNTHGRFNNTWQGFTFKWYGQLNAYPDLTGALLNSLTIAVLTAIIAGALGTLIGLAIGRYRFRGSGMTNLVTFAAISAPEVVMGASLLSMFLSLNIPRGYLTILIAHVMFSVSFVTVTVRARVMTLDPALEEAARDLGASPLATFRLVTLPILFPAILAGGLLSFALSIDDYIITSFNSGSTLTFPLWIWGSTRTGTPPQVNVLGTLIFVGGVVLALANAFMARRRNR
ncbi:MAG TPA: ABC transporter permease [Streptosporangiaceae bacterium]|jgi:spermidine/putrescine transport system permease protein